MKQFLHSNRVWCDAEVTEATEHTVSALLLVWVGEEILADGHDDLAAALGSPGTRRRVAGEEGTLLEEDPA